VHFIQKLFGDLGAVTVANNGVVATKWTKGCFSRLQITSVHPLGDLTRVKNCLAIKAPAFLARFKLTAITKALFMSGAERMTFGQIEHTRHGESSKPPQRCHATSTTQGSWSFALRPFDHRAHTALVFVLPRPHVSSNLLSSSAT
jgi:hypothetical protein